MTHPASQTFSTAPSRDPHASLLRRALAGNAVFSTLSGLFFALAPERVAELYSEEPFALLVVRAIGIGLLLFAAIVANEARRPRPRGLEVLLIAAGDAMWVLATLALLPFVWSDISLAGAELALAVALAVAFFCALQLAGLRAYFSTPAGHPRSARHCVAVEVDAAPALMWARISDLGDIAAHHPSLASSRLEGEPGVGAVRFCANPEGQAWSEECSAFDPEGRSLSVRFRHEEAGFPFPMREMIGGWDVVPAAGDARASLVRVWWEMTPSRATLGPLMIAMAAGSLDRAMVATIQHMAGTPNAEPSRATLLAC